MKSIRPNCVYEDDRTRVYLIDGVYWASEYGTTVSGMFETEAAAKAAVDLDSGALAVLSIAAYEAGRHGLITEAQVMEALQ